jgi:glucose-1-phosphate thymidylyltransferase
MQSNSPDRDKATREVIGLIPAAGRAERIGPLPCSKEIFPIGTRLINGGPEKRPKVACQYLLDEMRQAGITKAYIVLRQGKWDIPAYLQDGSMLGMDLGYLIASVPFGAPYTLDEAYPFVRDAIVAFGFPDILFQSDNGFEQLLTHQATSEADIVLGLFPADMPERMDIVDLEGSRVKDLIIQPASTHLQFSWDIAVWTPVFTKFLREYLADSDNSRSVKPELSVGHVIKSAIVHGLNVEAVPVSTEPYRDIGTPEGLARATERFGCP